MHGMKFLAAWLLFGVPSSLIACAVGNLIGWNAVTVALLVVLIEPLSCDVRRFLRRCKAS